MFSQLNFRPGGLDFLFANTINNKNRDHTLWSRPKALTKIEKDQQTPKAKSLDSINNKLTGIKKNNKEIKES